MKVHYDRGQKLQVNGMYRGHTLQVKGMYWGQIITHDRKCTVTHKAILLYSCL